MQSRTTGTFRRLFAELPTNVREQARRAYLLWCENPFHPSLAFKCIDVSRNIHSVRIGMHYRAIAHRDGEVMIWHWIGSHADYDTFLRRP